MGSSTFVNLVFFNTIAAPVVENMLLYTAYTTARRHYTVLQVVHDSA